MIQEIETLFLKEIESLNKVGSVFGFRERVKLERCLFLLLKFVCKTYLACQIHGFSHSHIERIKKKITPPNKSLLLILELLYEYKVFIKSLSSDSAYVMGDTISKVHIGNSEINSFLKSQADSLVSKIKHENLPHNYTVNIKTRT